jgi:hypothetical protein
VRPKATCSPTPTPLQLTTTSVVRGEAALFGATLICEARGRRRMADGAVRHAGRPLGGDVRVRADEIRIAPARGSRAT